MPFLSFLVHFSCVHFSVTCRSFPVDLATNFTHHTMKHITSSGSGNLLHLGESGVLFCFIGLVAALQTVKCTLHVAEKQPTLFLRLGLKWNAPHAKATLFAEILAPALKRPPLSARICHSLLAAMVVIVGHTCCVRQLSNTKSFNYIHLSSLTFIFSLIAQTSPEK